MKVQLMNFGWDFSILMLDTLCMEICLTCGSNMNKNTRVTADGMKANDQNEEGAGSSGSV